jgi:hypothetical protein
MPTRGTLLVTHSGSNPEQRGEHMSALDPDQLGNPGAIASAPEIYETDDPAIGLWNVPATIRRRVSQVRVSWRS